jgi:hypothetical protein
VLSILETFYYSPANIDVSVEGRYEPQITWQVDGKDYSVSSNPNLTPTVKTAYKDRKKVFNLEFSMENFPDTMAPFTVAGTLSFGASSSNTIAIKPFTVYKRGIEMHIYLNITVTRSTYNFAIIIHITSEHSDFRATARDMFEIRH